MEDFVRENTDETNYKYITEILNEEKRKYAMKIKMKHKQKVDNLLDEVTIRLQRR